jgi:hypothetical protein
MMCLFLYGKPSESGPGSPDVGGNDYFALEDVVCIADTFGVKEHENHLLHP